MSLKLISTILALYILTICEFLFFQSAAQSLPLTLFMGMWQPAVSVLSAVWCVNGPLLSALLRKDEYVNRFLHR